jgi:hypothetical protein
MPSIANNINNNSSVVNVGRTTPVAPGQQPAARSIPVVLASDQSPVPVVEQNKVQSEVALSLLGIPRAETALGIFADVNTYDVNPSEWSKSPQAYVEVGNFARGVKHLPNEAGALVTAGRNQNAVLTSKRFFRYQPGRVSAATFGIKTSVSLSDWAQNQVIRKFGIYDNYDGYYWENRQSGVDDNFSVVRRTQSLLKAPVSTFGTTGERLRGSATTTADTIKYNQLDDYRIVGKAPATLNYLAGTGYPRDRQVLNDQYFALEAALDVAVLADYANDANADDNGDDFYEAFQRMYNTYYGTSLTRAEVRDKCLRDLSYWLRFFQYDMEWGGNAHTKINLTNFITAGNLLGTSAAAGDYIGVTFESQFYTVLRSIITSAGASTYGLSSAGVSELQDLLDIVIAGFGNTTVATTANGVSTTTVVQQFTFTTTGGPSNTLSFGSRSIVDTIYDVKHYYWAYYVSKFNQGTTAYQGNTGLAVYYNAAGAAITNDNAIAYTSLDGTTFTLAEVKYKCQRDIGYIIDGFKNDLVGGGDAETKYNMSMYQKGTRGTYTAYGMSITSQIITEKLRYVHLLQIIKYDLTNKFGYPAGTSVYDKQVTLSTRVINNFAIEDTQSLIAGQRAYAGNLITQRDGLLMVHGAVYDPNLLKEQEAITTLVTASGGSTIRPNNSFELAPGKGVVTFGQHVKYVGADNGALVNETLYKVKSVVGPKGNVFLLVDEAGTNIVPASNATASFILVNPFILPKEYDPAYYMTGKDPYGNNRAITTDTFPKGMMFPYMYQINQNLAADLTTGARVGYVNTVPIGVESEEAFAGTTRDQIDKVNFVPEYINWIKNNVKPEFFGVYEYRVPRTRFSHDKLDGKNGVADDAFSLVYSDVATGTGGSKTRPGELVENTSVSLYNFDFTKVTMLKIEFSWYGAVGALFLAYIPVGNGEARWVRVHHLRASNQLKIASLGNATLPITYNLFGGGDIKTLGDGEEPRPGATGTTLADTGYGYASHTIVKYGASYYIDGGDRGTVRLYSHNNDEVVEAIGKQWTVTSGGYNVGDTSLTINATTMAGNIDANVDPTFFMGANIKTNDRRDQGIYVKWVDVASSKLMLSAVPNNTSTIRIMPDRANCVYGLETKRNILSTVESNSVRNRVQVYPTKLSAANLGDNPVRLRMKKTPIFQTDVDVSGKTFTLAAQHIVTSQNYPLSTTTLNPVSTPDTAPTETGGVYLQNGENIYGWFEAKLNGITNITPFGKLYKSADNYYFEILDTYNGPITLLAGKFLADGRYNADGGDYYDTRLETEKEGLSSIIIAYNTSVPIPGTGINIATMYLQGGTSGGTEQLDLSAYFDYNKEYLSYPLTDIADTLFFAVDSDATSGSATDNISLGITWEEQ